MSWHGCFRAQALIVRAAGKFVALPLAYVVEVMRPLPTEPLVGTPPAVRGAAIIRGEPTPVVDLAEVLGAAGAGAAQRMVLARTGDRRVGLLAGDVLGLRPLDEIKRRDVPPLVREACGQAVEAIGRLDDALLLLLRDARLVPDRVWHQVEEVDAKR